MLADANGCARPAEVGDTIQLQDGNDMAQASVTAINKATNDGKDPIVINLAVIDSPCDAGGPSYNQEALIVGFLRMKLVGARWTNAAPAKVAEACPMIGKKNVCVTADCSLVDAPGGGTVRVRGEKVYLVN
jgi:hypothetical protein